MLQPSAIPSSIPSDLAESLQQTLTGKKTWVLRALGTTVSLPTTPRAFVLILLTIAAICVGMVMHITLAMQIWQTSSQIEILQARYQAIEQQNTALVWDIAQKSTLENVRQRAVAMGYAIPLTRHYVSAPQPLQLALPAPTQVVAQAITAEPVILEAAIGSASTTNLQATTTVLGEWWRTQWQKLVPKL